MPEANSLFLPEALAYRASAIRGDAMRYLHPGTVPLSVLALLIVVLAWRFADHFTYTRKVEIPGRIDTNPAVPVSSGLHGRISTLMVTEGQAVDEQTPLLRIDAGKGRTRASRLEMMAELDRQFMGVALDGRAIQRAHQRTRIRLADERASRYGRLANLREQLSIQNEIVAQAAAQRTAVQLLREQQHLSSSDLGAAIAAELAAEQHKLQIQDALQTQEQALRLLIHDLAELPDRLIQDLAQTRDRFHGLRQQYRDLMPSDRETVASPVAGRVALIKLRPGSEVDPGDVIMVISGHHSQTTASFYVPTEAYAHIKPNDLVYVRLKGQNRDEMAPWSGTVVHLSDQPILMADGRPVFLCRVLLDGINPDVTLRTGMSVIARLPVETRSLLGWLREALRLPDVP
jgi:multidrug resistance efflux pump